MQKKSLERFIVFLWVISALLVLTSAILSSNGGPSGHAGAQEALLAAIYLGVMVRTVQATAQSSERKE